MRFRIERVARGKFTTAMRMGSCWGLKFHIGKRSNFIGLCVITTKNNNEVMTRAAFADFAGIDGVGVTADLDPLKISRRCYFKKWHLLCRSAAHLNYKMEEKATARAVNNFN